MKIFFPFLFSFFVALQSFSQCNTNTTICTPGVAGPFNFIPGSPNPSSCLDFTNGLAAPNYAYIILYITVGGDLNLLINGDQNNGFLDVAIFDITTAIDPCASLGIPTEIGCNYADFPNGCNEFGSNFPCTSEVPAPPVNAGDVIMILVEDWSDVQTTFTLELSNAPGSAQTGPPDPTITPVANVCVTDAPFQLIAVDGGGTWSGTGVSATGLFDPSISGPGTFTIDYNIGVSPCDAMDQTVITVLDISANAGFPNRICLGSNFLIGADPVFNVEGATYSWDNGAGAGTIDLTGAIQDNGQVSVSPIVSTTFEVTVDNGGCIATDQVLVQVDQPPTALNPNTINVQCFADIPPPNPDVVTTEADDYTASPVVTWQGDISDGLSCPETISRTYRVTDECANHIDVVQTIIINDDISPVFDPIPADTSLECIEDLPFLMLSYTDNCDGLGSVLGIDVSDGGSCPEIITRTWTYTDGCGNNSTTASQIITIIDTQAPVFDPVPLDTTVGCIGDVPTLGNLGYTDNCDGSGLVLGTDVSDGGSCPEIITRTWTITDNCGNNSTVSQTITVIDITPPTASNPPNISVPGLIDVPPVDILVVNDEIDNCTINPIVTWVSDVSDGNVCNGEIITRTYSILDDCGNESLVTQEITILAVYSPIDAGLDQLVCEGDTTVVTAINPMGVPIVWDNGLVDGADFIPVANTTYTVTADNNGCITTDTMSIVIEELPIVSFSADELSGCAPLNVTFTNNTVASSNLFNCVWNIEGASSISGCINVNYLFNLSGTYDVSLITTTENGCVNSVTYSDYIFVEEVPSASFIPSTTSISSFSPEINFQNTSIGASSYDWSFGDGANSTEFSPSHIYPETESNYTVQLIASSLLGCVDTAYVDITVEEPLIYYVPNTFTPDGDQYNQTFKPIFTSGYDPYNFTILIFNRWGEIIWESHDDKIGWDGTYGGQVMADGLYSWKITYQLSADDEPRVISGLVNLLR